MIAYKVHGRGSVKALPYMACSAVARASRRWSRGSIPINGALRCQTCGVTRSPATQAAPMIC
jgi:hypothetical protein